MPAKKRYVFPAPVVLQQADRVELRSFNIDFANESAELTVHVMEEDGKIVGTRVLKFSMDDMDAFALAIEQGRPPDSFEEAVLDELLQTEASVPDGGTKENRPPSQPKLPPDRLGIKGN